MEAEERTKMTEELGDVANGAKEMAEPTTETFADQPNGAAETESQDELTTASGENGFKRKRSPLPEGMSRSAYKKLKRQQAWDAGKADRRAKEREKKRTKNAERRAAIEAGEIPKPAPKPPKERGTTVPVTFIFDCSFDELMTENEIKSLASQITRCYSDNNHMKYKAHLAVSSFNARLKERFEGPLEAQYKVWKGVEFYGEDFVDVAKKSRELMRDEKHGGKIEGALANSKTASGEVPAQDDEHGGEIIYLSSESDNTIESLSPYSTYIIGGLVDRNRHKGICYKRACDRGIKTAKLPIGEFMEMNSRYVLATNHVNEIMLNWLECGDWGEAFMKVIPKRKGGKLKGEEQDTQVEADDEEAEPGAGTQEEDGEGADLTPAREDRMNTAAVGATTSKFDEEGAVPPDSIKERVS